MHLWVVSNWSFGLLINFWGLVCGANHTSGNQEDVLVFFPKDIKPPIHPLRHSILQPVYTEYLPCAGQCVDRKVRVWKTQFQYQPWAALCSLWPWLLSVKWGFGLKISWALPALVLQGLVDFLSRDFSFPGSGPLLDPRGYLGNTAEWGKCRTPRSQASLIP